MRQRVTRVIGLFNDLDQLVPDEVEQAHGRLFCRLAVGRIEKFLLAAQTHINPDEKYTWLCRSARAVLLCPDSHFPVGTIAACGVRAIHFFKISEIERTTP